MKLCFFNWIIHFISDDSNNISTITTNLDKDTDIKIIDVNNNIFYLLSNTNKFFTLSIPKIVMLTKIKIRYLMPL